MHDQPSTKKTKSKWSNALRFAIRSATTTDPAVHFHFGVGTLLAGLYLYSVPLALIVTGALWTVHALTMPKHAAK